MQSVRSTGSSARLEGLTAARKRKRINNLLISNHTSAEEPVHEQ